MTPTRFHIAHIVPDPRLHGLYGYREVIETLQWGLEALGYPTSVAENEFANGSTNIIFGFQMLSEQVVDSLPPDSIVYNFEQMAGLQTDALKPVYRAAARRLRVWEYSEHNLSSWAQLDPVQAVINVPVGWAPILARIPEPADQDIDVLLYGLPGKLRLAIFRQLAEAGAVCIFACGVYGASRDALIGRSKLVLNINLYASSRIFEIVRVSYLLANAKAVVADLRPDTFVESDVRDAVAFEPPEGVAARCFALLGDETVRRELGKRGAETMRRRDIRVILSRALGLGKPDRQAMLGAGESGSL
jgi:hypothetical protein